jgi:hypothetical protein
MALGGYICDDSLSTNAPSQPPDTSVPRWHINLINPNGDSLRWANIWADLVDWKGDGFLPYQDMQTTGSFGRNHHLFFYTNSLSLANAVYTLASILGLCEYPSEGLTLNQTEKPVPEVIHEMFAVLDRLKPPVILSHPVPSDTMRVITRREAEEIISIVEQFESLPRKFPKQRLLGGYARLYALILRGQWYANSEETIRRFARLEQEYQSIPAIAIMAGWYRAVFMAWASPLKGQKGFKDFRTRYTRFDWWVVETARHLESIPNCLVLRNYDYKAPQYVRQVQLFFLRKRMSMEKLKP